MKHRDVLMLMDGVAPAIASLLGKAIAPLFERMAATDKRVVELEAALKEAGVVIDAIGAKILEVPKDVAALELKIEGDELKKVVAEAVGAVGLTIERLAIELGEVRDMVTGLPGPDGLVALVDKAVDAKVAALPPTPTVADIAALVKMPTAEEVAALVPIPVVPTAEEVAVLVPAGKDASPEMVASMVVSEVDKRMQEIPMPRDGADGKDGVGLAGALIDREGQLVVTLTDGTTKALGAIVGKDGSPGAAGLGFDDMTEELADDGRTIIRRYSRGEQVKEVRFTLPVVLDRGVYKDGVEYVAGDGVSFGGSFWIARAVTKDKPGTSDSWRLAVKKGRDGKDGRDLGPPPPSPPVKLK